MVIVVKMYRVYTLFSIKNVENSVESFESFFEKVENSVENVENSVFFWEFKARHFFENTFEKMLNGILKQNSGRKL